MKRGIPDTFLLTPVFQPEWHFCGGQLRMAEAYISGLPNLGNIVGITS